MEKFCNDLDRVLDKGDNGLRLYILRDRNGWVGDRIKVHITGGFGVPEEDGNGRRVID